MKIYVFDFYYGLERTGSRGKYNKAEEISPKYSYILWDSSPVHEINGLDEPVHNSTTREMHLCHVNKR